MCSLFDTSAEVVDLVEEIPPKIQLKSHFGTFQWNKCKVPPFPPDRFSGIIVKYPPFPPTPFSPDRGGGGPPGVGGEG